jgi:hypothetical protein
MSLRRRLALLGAGAISSFAALAVIAAVSAHAAAYLPPPGKVYAGLTGNSDFPSYDRAVGKHSPVVQFFSSYGASLDWMFEDAERHRARLMLHLSTGRGTRELASPGAIARGAMDGFLLRLNARIAEGGRPVYIRLMSEMNGHWNPYSAFHASGRPRGREHSTTAFRRAWRRTVTIVRGGEVAAIDRRLRSIGLPPLQRARRPLLPRPQVAFLWVPQVAGAPDIRANAPRAYWPGARYVDWVGTDFYSRFPNFAGLERFYREFGGKPFAFGEWALWGRDDPAFVRRLFRWIRTHRRTRMVMYNHGNRADGPFRLWRYPRGRAALRAELASSRFAPWVAEYDPRHGD